MSSSPMNHHVEQCIKDKTFPSKFRQELKPFGIVITGEDSDETCLPITLPKDWSLGGDTNFLKIIDPQKKAVFVVIPVNSNPGGLLWYCAMCKH